MVLPPGWAGGGGGGANLGTAQGSIVINTAQLAQALGQVRNFANQVNAAMGKVGQGVGGGGNVAAQVNQTTSAMDALAAKAKQVAVALGALQIGGWAMQTSQALTQAQVRFESITGSASAAADQVNRIRVRARELGVAANETLDVFAGIAPLIEEGKSGLDSYVGVMSRLAVLDPAQGLRGAAFAVREALASLGEGRVDFRSLSERFEIAKPQLRAALEATGGDLAKALDIVLNKMGITEESAQRMAKTFLGASRVLKDEVGRTLAITFGPFFDKVGEVMLMITNTLARINDIAPGLLSIFGAIIGAVSLFATLNAGIPRLITMLKSLAAAATLAKEATAGKAVRAGAAVAGGVALGIGAANLIGRATGNERLATATLETLLGDIKNILSVALAGLITVANQIGATLQTISSDLQNVLNPSYFQKSDDRGMFRQAPSAEFFQQIFSEIFPEVGESRDAIVELVQSINRGEFTRSGAVLQGEEVIQVGARNAQQLLNDVIRYFSTAKDVNLGAVVQQIVDPVAKQQSVNAETARLLQQYVSYGLSQHDVAALQNAIESSLATNAALRNLFGVQATTPAEPATAPLANVNTEPTDEMLQATKDYLDAQKALQAEYEEKFLQAEADNEEKRLDIIDKYAQRRADIEAAAAERRGEAALEFQENYQEIVDGRNESIAEVQQQAIDEEIEREEKKRKDLEKLDREHRLNLFEAAANLDARAVDQENRRYNEQLRTLEENDQEQKAQRQKALNDQLAQIDESANKQIQKLIENTQKAEEKAARRDERQLAKLAEQEALEQAEREAAYEKQLNDLITQNGKEAEALWNGYVDQLAALGDHNAQMLQLARDGYTDLEAEYDKLIGYMKSAFEEMKIAQAGSLAAVNMGDPAAEQAYYDSLAPLIEKAIPVITQKWLEGVGLAGGGGGAAPVEQPKIDLGEGRNFMQLLSAGLPMDIFMNASNAFIDLIKMFKDSGEDAEGATKRINLSYDSAFENVRDLWTKFERVGTNVESFLNMLVNLWQYGDEFKQIPQNVMDLIGQVLEDPSMWNDDIVQRALNDYMNMLTAPREARTSPEAMLAYAQEVQRMLDAYEAMTNGADITDEDVNKVNERTVSVIKLAESTEKLSVATKKSMAQMGADLASASVSMSQGAAMGAALGNKAKLVTDSLTLLGQSSAVAASAAANSIGAAGQAAAKMMGTAEAVGRGVDKIAVRAKPALDTVPNNLNNFANSVANVISGVFNFVNRLFSAARSQGSVITQQTQNQAPRAGQLMVTQFAGGTNSTPYTGLFGLHAKEVVLDPRVSEMARNALGPNVNERLPGALAGGTGRGGFALTWNGDLVVQGANLTPDEVEIVATNVVVGAFEKLVTIHQGATGTA